jgi:5-formyltetrahydrofolate cyclo-ligase
MWSVPEAREAARRLARLARAAIDAGVDQALLEPIGKAYREALRTTPPRTVAVFWDELGAEPDTRALAFCLAALAEVEPTGLTLGHLYPVTETDDAP